ncbi:MAG: alpha/beta hydrolase [Phenylobacterium sp.]|nr:MAG: alpha/beta hydrolase [Phenylobacterium sp.]
MTEDIDHLRRSLFGAAALTVAAAELAASRPAAAQARSGALASFGPVRQVDAGPLNIGYVDMGPAGGPPAILLHGWPYDIHSFADAAPLLAAKGYRVIVPYLRGFGSTRFLNADTFRNGQPSVFALDTVALMDALKIDKAVIAGFDWGTRTADIVALLWPERCKALVSISGYTAGVPTATPQPPDVERQWWYEFYFATEQGRAGYARNRHDFAKLIWKLASPKWAFDDATFDRSAVAFENPDHVDITIHNYRWRQGLVKGEARYDALEARLAPAPVIKVPTIVLEGDANGAPHLPDDKLYRQKFVGRYAFRMLPGIGHNLPQEAPQAFAQAVIDVDGF